MLPVYPTAFWVCAVGAVLLIGIAKAGFGGGVGILAMPLLALTVPVADAAALLLPLLPPLLPLPAAPAVDSIASAALLH